MEPSHSERTGRARLPVILGLGSRDGREEPLEALTATVWQSWPLKLVAKEIAEPVLALNVNES